MKTIKLFKIIEIVLVYAALSLIFFDGSMINIAYASAADLVYSSIEDIFDYNEKKTADIAYKDVDEEDGVVVLDNSFIRVVYLDSVSSIGISGVQVNMRFVNKTDKNLWIYLTDAQLNDEMVPMVMGGACDLNANAKLGKVFIFPITEFMTIKSIDDVREFTFVINVSDQDTMETYEVSKPITISVNSHNNDELSDTEQETERNVILDNDYITATYLNSDESIGINGIQVNMRFENKTDKKLWVYLTGAQLNDEMVPMVMSGTPCYINPKAKAGKGFLFPINNNMIIKSIEDITEITFAINISDCDTMETYEVSKPIVITIP